MKLNRETALCRRFIFRRRLYKKFGSEGGGRFFFFGGGGAQPSVSALLSGLSVCVCDARALWLSGCTDRDETWREDCSGAGTVSRMVRGGVWIARREGAYRGSFHRLKPERKGRGKERAKGKGVKGKRGGGGKEKRTKGIGEGGVSEGKERGRKREEFCAVVIFPKKKPRQAARVNIPTARRSVHPLLQCSRSSPTDRHIHTDHATCVAIDRI